jgi:HAD superfamily hydrolase (TIGR01509 family)
MLRAIVFDFDGVIANTEPLHFLAFRDVLAEDSVELSEDDYYSRYLGYSDEGAFRKIAEDRGLGWSEAQLAAVWTRKAARLEQLERDRSVLFPGAEDAIRRAAAVVPIAIASGALRHEIVRVLDRAGLTPLFRVIVAAGDTAASKPAPDPYLAAVAQLSALAPTPIAGADCVAIEDSPWGVNSARDAELRTVAVTTSYDTRAFAAADLVIANISALDVPVLQQLVVSERRPKSN